MTTHRIENMAETLSTEQNTLLSEIEIRLGRRVSELRSSRGYTLDRLASETGFTKGYLSKIENSKVIPPIGTLVKIAQALQTELAELLGETNPELNNGIYVVRSWERETVMRGGSSFGYDYVALANKRRHKQMDPFVMVFPSTIGPEVRFEHDGEEFLFVLDGQIEFSFTLEGRERQWILSPGDSLYFDSKIPHRGRSLKGESRALVVIAHPSE
jgi:transcriptional regulator with XRE-family HTH domain